MVARHRRQTCDRVEARAKRNVRARAAAGKGRTVSRHPGITGVPPASAAVERLDLKPLKGASAQKRVAVNSPHLSVSSFWQSQGTTRARLQLAVLCILGCASAPLARAGYHIENVKYPAEIRGGISAVTFTPTGQLVIATRLGEVWIRFATADPVTSASSAQWRLFTRGLDEPMGLFAESDRVIYIAHRPELLRAAVKNEDGRAETFDALGGKWGLSQNYHEFFFGLARDRNGNFYGSASLDSTISSSPQHKTAYPKLPVRGIRNFDPVLEPSGHRSETPYRGWVVRISPDGQFEPFANGFRQTNGMALR